MSVCTHFHHLLFGHPLSRLPTGLCIIIQHYLISVILNFSASFLLSKVPGMNPGRHKRFFSCPNCPYRLWGPPCLPFDRHLGSFLGIKRLEREANYSPPCSGEVSEWNCICTRLYARTETTLSLRARRPNAGYKPSGWQGTLTWRPAELSIWQQRFYLGYCDLQQ